MKIGIIVTTKHRGVFFGYIEEGELPTSLPAEITLANARMCVRWSIDVHGVLGLGATGPSKDCRITKGVPELKLYEVTAIIHCAPEAIIAWENGPWGN